MTYMLAFSKKRKRRKKAINIISLLTAMENVTEGGLKGLHNPNYLFSNLTLFKLMNE